MLNRVEVVEYLRDVSDIWNNESMRCTSKVMKKYFADDSRDLERVSALLEDDRVQAACYIADGLDTFVRETIAMDVWNYFDSVDSRFPR